MPNINYRTFESARDLGATAQDLADANGAPVAILSRDGLWRVCELASLYELLCDVEHWQTEALIDPWPTEVTR